jgi:hypothetical protein
MSYFRGHDNLNDDLMLSRGFPFMDKGWGELNIAGPKVIVLIRGRDNINADPMPSRGFLLWTEGGESPICIYGLNTA